MIGNKLYHQAAGLQVLRGKLEFQACSSYAMQARRPLVFFSCEIFIYLLGLYYLTSKNDFKVHWKFIQNR